MSNNDDMQKIAEDLIVAHQEYQDLFAALQKQDPELFEKFKNAKEKCDNLESALKGLYRGAPDAELDVPPEYKFRVSHSKKKDLDLESAVLQADHSGHIEVLLEYGVLEFKGNASKVERLPTDIRPLYEDLIETKTTTRVSPPKSLKRPW